MRGTLFLALRLALCVGAFAGSHLDRANAQADSISLMQTVSGHIDQDTQRFTFAANKGQPVGIRLNVTAGTLIATLDCFDSAGKSLARVTHAHKSAALDSIVIPADGTYSISVSGTTDTSGDFTLTLLPGFSTLLLDDPMDGQNRWQVSQQDRFSSQFSDGKLRLQYTADNRFTWTAAEQIGALRDVYVQALFHNERPAVYTEYGLLIRGTSQADGTLSFYVFMINSTGNFRFALSTSTHLTVIQDWTPLGTPGASIPSDGTLGLLARGNRFMLIYNSRVIAVLTDSSLTTSGQIGLVIGTGHAGTPSDMTASVLISRVIVTVPQDVTPIKIPAALKDWQRAPERIIAELQAANLISSAGKLTVSLPQAYIRNYADGLALQKLAKGAAYTNLVIIADVSWDSTQTAIACGITVRYTDSDHFTMAYMDRQGGFGVYQVQGANHPLANYALSSGIKTANLAVNRLILIADNDTLTLYINGELVASGQTQTASGAVAVASYNYQAASVRCEFDNLALYTFDS